MDKSKKQNQEKTYLWIPFQFLDQILKALFKYLGLLHRNSSALSPEKEEKEYVFEEEDVVVLTKGNKNGVVITSRATNVKGKIVKKENHSTGSSGQHN